MPYYLTEHLQAYARIRREGLEQWNDLHPADAGRGFDDFPGRALLQRTLPPVSDGSVSVLEYGCGTGPAACFLASRGYAVHAVDLVQDAIEVARGHAARRGLLVRFEVQDVCRWGEPTERYDVVVDCLCLQSVVTDEHRDRLLDGVRRRLWPGGRYLITTAMQQPGRDYGDDHYDVDTGMVWAPAAGPVEAATMINNQWYLPNRRHLGPAALRSELERHGFVVVEQTGPYGGELACVPASGSGGA